MSTTINSGRNFFVWNFSVGTSMTQIVLNQYVSSLIIRCRSNVDIYINENGRTDTYFTIPAGTSFTLDISTLTLSPFWLQSSSGTVTVEILGAQE